MPRFAGLPIEADTTDTVKPRFAGIPFAQEDGGELTDLGVTLPDRAPGKRIAEFRALPDEPSLTERISRVLQPSTDVVPGGSAEAIAQFESGRGPGAGKRDLEEIGAKSNLLERGLEDFASGAISTGAGLLGMASRLGSESAGQWKGALDVTTESLMPADPTFLDELSSGFGSTATFFIPGTGIAKGAQAVAKVAPRMALWLGAGAAAGMEAAVESGMVYDDLRQRGYSHDVASSRADKTFWANAGLLAVTNRFGLFGDYGGKLVKATLSAVMEGGQEGAQQVISNLAEGREDITEGVGKSALIGGIVGGGTSLALPGDYTTGPEGEIRDATGKVVSPDTLLGDITQGVPAAAQVIKPLELVPVDQDPVVLKAVDRISSATSVDEVIQAASDAISRPLTLTEKNQPTPFGTKVIKPETGQVEFANRTDQEIAELERLDAEKRGKQDAFSIAERQAQARKDAEMARLAPESRYAAALYDAEMPRTVSPAETPKTLLALRMEKARRKQVEKAQRITPVTPQATEPLPESLPPPQAAISPPAQPQEAIPAIPTVIPEPKPQRERTPRGEIIALAGDQAETLRDFANRSGWSEKGGRLLRERLDSDMEGSATGPVIGRTKWVPNADWWPDFMRDKSVRMKPGQLRTTVEKAAIGHPLSAREARAVRWLLDEAIRQPEQEQFEDEAYAEDPAWLTEPGQTPIALEPGEERETFDVIHKGLQMGLDVDIIEDIVERAAIQDLSNEDILRRFEDAVSQKRDQEGAAAVPVPTETRGQAETAPSQEVGLLQPYTEADLAEREQAAQKRTQSEREALQRAAADAEVDTFTLTGSDRTADVAASRGQQDLLSQPATLTPAVTPASKVQDILIRLATNKEKLSRKLKTQVANSFPERKGFKVVFKPYGKDGDKSGAGFYYNRTIPQDETHDYSSTQTPLPKDLSDEVKQIATRVIAPDDIHAEEGLEDRPHITVKYGLHTKDVNAVTPLLADVGPIQATVGQVEIFSPEEKDYDVIVQRIDSPALHALNQKLSDNLEVTDTHPEYKPHITIGYVKRGTGDKYKGVKTVLEGRTINLDTLEFSGQDGNITPIKLAGKPALSTETPAQEEITDGRKRAEWRSLGRDLSAALPYNASRFNPQPKDFIEAAASLDITPADAATAWRIYDDTQGWIANPKRRSPRTIVTESQREAALASGLQKPEPPTAAPVAESIQAPVEKPERYAVGRSLDKAQRKKVLDTLVDVYKLKGAPTESKGFDQEGAEIFGYVYSPDLFEKSSITGAGLRYIVTLPDGRIAHPSELFPDYTQSDIDRVMAERKYTEQQEILGREDRIRILNSRKAGDMNTANSIFWKQNAAVVDKMKPEDTALLTDGKQFVRVHKQTADKDLSILGVGWKINKPSAQTETPDPLTAAATKMSEAADKLATAVDKLSNVQKIEDLGEKIGGARKDTSVPLGTRGKGNAVEEVPAWRKRYTAVQNMAGEGEKGKWSIADTKTETILRGSDYRPMVFDTQEAAEQAMPLVAVSQKHRVYSTRDGRFTVYRTDGDRKRVQAIPETFATREEAMQHMADNAESILESKLSFGEEVLPTPAPVYRPGVERRTGDVKGQDFMATFGFRGVEFGNWNNQAERQEVVNHAYDALLDMAEILKVPPLALSLNGDLALAFGARGQGLSGAKAHYERSYAVINLTKMSGAGSLAHEWLHSLDHYFSRLDGAASSEKETNDRGDLVYKTKGVGKDYASHGFLYNSKARQELRDAYTNLIQTMFKKAEVYVKDTARAEEFVGKARDELKRQIEKISGGLAMQLDPSYWKRNNKQASTEQLTRFNELSEKLLNGESAGLELRKNEGSKSKFGSYRQSNDVLDEMAGIYKTIRGRSGFTADKEGLFDGLRGHISNYQQRIKALQDARGGNEKTKKVITSYYMQAKAADQAKAGDYWASPHEMAARAFSAYVEDKLKEIDASNDFLAYHAHGAVIVPVYPEGLFRPFPEGEERKEINQAFDKLFEVIQTKETDQGVAMFSLSDNTIVSASIKFAKQVTDYLAGGLKANVQLDLGTTPFVLQHLGAPSLPLVMDQSIAKKAITGITEQGVEKHPPIAVNSIKQLVPKLNDPIAVFNSKTEPGAYVVLTELQDTQGDPVVVAVHTGLTSNQGKVNKIASVYGKESISALQSWIDNDLRYLRKGKASRLTNLIGVQFPEGSALEALQGSVVTNEEVFKGGIRLSMDRAIDAPTTFTKAQVEAAIASARKGVSDTLGLQINVIESSEIPTSVKAQIPAGKIPKGFVYQGQVYLVADAMNNARDAQVQFAHEVIGHMGMEAIMGEERWQALLQRFTGLKKLGSKEFQSILQEVHSRYADQDGNIDPTQEMKEFIAMAAESREQAGTVATFLRQVREFLAKALRALGFKQPFSVTQIHELLSESERYIREGGEQVQGEMAPAFSTSDRNATFYSQLLKTVQESTQTKATPQQWEALFKKSGVKQEEIDWLDVRGFFSGDRKSTRL